MPLNSLPFGLFLAGVAMAGFLLPGRHRWGLLLASSCVFYMAFVPAHLAIVAAMILVTYACARGLERSDGLPRRLLFSLSVCTSLGALLAFKCLGTGSAAGTATSPAAGWPQALSPGAGPMPIGLSFLVFLLLGYVVDVHRGLQPAERHPGIFALCALFFPKVVAGPLERPRQFLLQLREAPPFDYARVVGGLRLIAWGLLRKTVIADPLGVFVDAVYGDPRRYAGLPLLLATYLYAIQIYCDFAGYTDIARGSARVLGYKLVPNFRQPYLAGSIPEFWRRWHMSLMSWLREYLWWPLVRRAPLEGSPWAGVRRAGSMLVVFLVCGFWHGVTWTFVAWGGLHGLYMVASPRAGAAFSKMARWTRIDRAPRVLDAIAVCATFNLVSLGWVFFRANSLGDAWYVVTHMLSGGALQLRFGVGLGVGRAVVAGTCFVMMESVQWACRTGRFSVGDAPALVRWSGYAAVVLLVTFFGSIQSNAGFIYFRF